jgi:hypothetical protein
MPELHTQSILQRKRRLVADFVAKVRFEVALIEAAAL